MQIEFEIDGMRLTRTSDAYVTEGSKNFVQLLFTLLLLPIFKELNNETTSISAWRAAHGLIPNARLLF